MSFYAAEAVRKFSSQLGRKSDSESLALGLVHWQPVPAPACTVPNARPLSGYLVLHTVVQAQHSTLRFRFVPSRSGFMSVTNTEPLVTFRGRVFLISWFPPPHPPTAPLGLSTTLSQPYPRPSIVRQHLQGGVHPGADQRPGLGLRCPAEQRPHSSGVSGQGEGHKGCNGYNGYQGHKGCQGRGSPRGRGRGRLGVSGSRAVQVVRGDGTSDFGPGRG